MAKPLKITSSSRFRKTVRKTPLPMLPGDAALIRQIEAEREANRASRVLNEPLDYTGPLKNFSPYKVKPNAKEVDLNEVIPTILDKMWEEYPVKESGSYKLGPKLLAETEQFRRECPPMVTLNQLYGVFPLSATKVDQAVNRMARLGQLKVVQVSSIDGSRDFVIDTRRFEEICGPVSPQLVTVCRQRAEATWFSPEELLAAQVDTKNCISRGLLVVDPTRGGAHILSLPFQGRMLRLIGQGRKWLLKTMVQHNPKFRELPESQIKDKLENSKQYWTQLHGVSLDWILYDAIGGGFVDGFQTPMGRGWKVLKTN